MRLKTFHADTISEAMELVRAQLGPDAIIVATQDQENGHGARVTAAIEEEDQLYNFEEAVTSDSTLEIITASLEQHGTPIPLTDALVELASESGIDEPIDALSYALDARFRFVDLLAEEKPKNRLFVGPPGTGKTVATVKFAARLMMASKRTKLLCADNIRLMAANQLRAYGERLRCEFEYVDGAKECYRSLKASAPDIHHLIDTPGINPYNLSDIAYVIELSDMAKDPPILVLGAGRAAEEAADLAETFRPAHCKYLVFTGYDIARRLGGMLAAADAAGLAFTILSDSPQIAEGFETLTPQSLARYLLPRTLNGRV